MDQGFLAYDVYCGVDVGKSSHHMTAITSKGQQTIFSEEIPQEESAIRTALSQLSASGRLLLTVDQPRSVGSLLVGTAKAMGIDTAFLTPHDFHQFAKAYSEVKSDKNDAFIIADISMRMTGRLHPVENRDETVDAIRMLSRHRAGLVREITQRKNGIHDLFVQTHPALGNVFGSDELNSKAWLKLLIHYGGATGFKNAGKNRVLAFMDKIPYCRNKGQKAEKIFDALNRQTIRSTMASEAEGIFKYYASEILRLKSEVKKVEAIMAERAMNVKECRILNSLPGIGNVFSATIISEIGSIHRFKDAGHMAAYSGVAPSKRQSGSTMDGSRKKKRYNRILKNAMCESAWISVSFDESSRAYYQKKRTEGKTHKAAILALARHRTDIIYAMLKDGSMYEPKAIAQ
jgi:transposase